MGNIQAYINYHTELSFTQNLDDQIHFCETIQHHSLGKIQIWKIKDNQSQKLFSFTRHIYHSDSTLLKIHQQRCSLQHPNLLQYYACTQTQPTFCGSVESQNFFFEYQPHTMQKVLDERRGTLPEIDIWKFLEQMVDVLYYLQENQCFHGNISLENIFVKEDNTIKILDSFNKQLTDYLLKQDVYDLATVVIELMTKQKFHKEFKETLKSLTDQYSLQLLSVLAKMLNKNPDNRPCFKDLSTFIKNRTTQPIEESKKQESVQLSFHIKQNLNQTTLTNILVPQNQNYTYLLDNTIKYYPQKVCNEFKFPLTQVKYVKKKNYSMDLGPFQVDYQESTNDNMDRNNKPSMHESQTSTVGSHQISFLETWRGNLNFTTKQLSYQNKIKIQQQNSSDQNILIQDDLNKTNSTFY
ncbi:unnamed protein product [Paramecium primaurelia]|uniref:Protein kinase domain-containing protein n=1 Tax=Paramecium primaurelia TaxID=5886 RepID=A0A8S1P1B9_PARPR|nr:unnamed protein product [Paramecium primaurelia]